MFSLLQQYDIECYKCNNHGHMARDCKLKTPTRNTIATQSQSTKQKKYWREKEENESSMIALWEIINQNLWHLESGCSKHMIGDSSKFITLKDNKGKVTFGDSLSSKIIGKRIVVVNSKIKAENVLLVENLKPNLLSVSQTCDQGYICIFDSEKCEIKNKKLGNIVGIVMRNANNVYILENENKRYLSMIDESWLCHRMLGHISFDNLSKISAKEFVRDLPKNVAPLNAVCKHCQHGKQTRASFKTKEHMSSHPLEIVHTYLCGPTRTKIV